MATITSGRWVQLASDQEISVQGPVMILARNSAQLEVAIREDDGTGLPVGPWDQLGDPFPPSAVEARELNVPTKTWLRLAQDGNEGPWSVAPYNVQG